MANRTAQNRVDALNEAGVNTNRFVFNLPGGLDAGSTITVDINNGQAINTTTGEVVAVDDVVQSGYIKNNKLHRRWVMAQMFRMLNSGDYSKYLKVNYTYMYQFKMLEDELNVLMHMEQRDPESFRARKMFFTKNVVYSLFEDYLNKIDTFLATLKRHYHHKNGGKREYITIPRYGHIYTDKVDGCIRIPIQNMLVRINRCDTFRELYNLVYNFNHQKKVRLQDNTKKCQSWVSAFKGSGAYYTLQNMINFHNVFVIDDDGNTLRGDNAMSYVDSKLEEYKGQGWRYLGMLKKVIADNNFTFGA